MSKLGMGRVLPCMALWVGALAWANAPLQAPKPSKVNPTAMANPQAPVIKAESKTPEKPALPSTPASASGNAQVTPDANGSPAEGAVKTALAEAYIAQGVLRVYLDRPAAVSVYNSRGQRVFHLDSRRAMEIVPLQGITTGFLYLTVRTTQGEVTRKLVYTGK